MWSNGIYAPKILRSIEETHVQKFLKSQYKAHEYFPAQNTMKSQTCFMKPVLNIDIKESCQRSET